MAYVTSIVMGILPMVIYALFVWRIDRWEKEPLPLVIAVFIWGFLPSAIFALIAQMILGVPGALLSAIHPLIGEIFGGTIVAPITEELIKGFALALLFIFYRHEIDSVLDGIVYGCLAGFGFAAIENILYFFSQAAENPADLWVLIFLRAFVFGLNHAAYTSFIGIGFALARFAKDPILRFVYVVLGLTGAILMHAMHNFLVTFGGVGAIFAIAADWIGILGLFALVGFCVIHENGWIQKYLTEEVEAGVISQEQATDAASYWKRSSLNFFVLGPRKFFERRQLLHDITELAYKKHQLKRLGEDVKISGRIATLRQELTALQDNASVTV